MKLSLRQSSVSKGELLIHPVQEFFVGYFFNILKTLSNKMSANDDSRKVAKFIINFMKFPLLLFMHKIAISLSLNSSSLTHRC